MHRRSGSLHLPGIGGPGSLLCADRICDRLLLVPSNKLSARAQAWKDAKHRGHRLEEFLCGAVSIDVNRANELSQQCFGEKLGLPRTSLAGGASAKHVPSIIGGASPSKVDLTFEWKSLQSEVNLTARLSHKSSLDSQAYLIQTDRFFDGLEARGLEVAVEVRDSLRLFICCKDRPAEVEEFLAGRPHLGKIHRRTGLPIDQHQVRISGQTFRAYAPDRWQNMLVWLDEYRIEVAHSVLSTGLAIKNEDHATHLWYFKEDGTPDEIFKIDEILQSVNRLDTFVRDNNQNAATTIKFTFGKLQMHLDQAQFRHSHKQISGMLKAK